MRNESLVTKTRIGVVTFDPVDHVTAIAGAGRADAGLIDVRQIRRHRDAIADVGEDLAAPVSGYFGDELLPVTGRTPRIRHEDHVSMVSVDLRIPAIPPIVIPGALR